jgi:hypothetical protein
MKPVKKTKRKLYPEDLMLGIFFLTVLLAVFRFLYSG